MEPHPGWVSILLQSRAQIINGLQTIVSRQTELTKEAAVICCGKNSMRVFAKILFLKKLLWQGLFVHLTTTCDQNPRKDQTDGHENCRKCGSNR